ALELWSPVLKQQIPNNEGGVSQRHREDGYRWKDCSREELREYKQIVKWYIGQIKLATRRAEEDLYYADIGEDDNHDPRRIDMSTAVEKRRHNESALKYQQGNQRWRVTKANWKRKYAYHPET